MLTIPPPTCPQERQKRSIKLTNELQRLSPLLDEAQAQENQWKGTNKRLAQKAKVRFATPPRAPAHSSPLVHHVSFTPHLIHVSFVDWSLWHSIDRVVLVALLGPLIIACAVTVT